MARQFPWPPESSQGNRDVLAWWKESPDDWRRTWRKIDAKYQRNPDYRRFSCSKGDFNIDAKINGAYIIMGLLYGEGDPDKTIIVSTRCRLDSDCNPSNAGGDLFTTIGRAAVPKCFTSALKENVRFSHTAYDFKTLLDVCEKLAREAVVQAGGRIEKDASGEEFFVVPVQKPKPGPREQCWEPGKSAGSRFTAEEMKKVTKKPEKEK